MIESRFAYGFGCTVFVAAIFTALSAIRAWFDPGCADCIVSAGVPFPMVAHGGFFTQTFLIWDGVRDNAVAILGVASLTGWISTRVLADDYGGAAR